MLICHEFKALPKNFRTSRITMRFPHEEGKPLFRCGKGLQSTMQECITQIRVAFVKMSLVLMNTDHGQLETIMTYTVHIDMETITLLIVYNPAVVLISSFHYQIIMTKRFHFNYIIVRSFRGFGRKKENYYYYYSNKFHKFHHGWMMDPFTSVHVDSKFSFSHTFSHSLKHLIVLLLQLYSNKYHKITLKSIFYLTKV